MLAVCNVAVVVSDSAQLDTKLLRFLRALDEARTKFPDLFPAAGDKEKLGTPELCTLDFVPCESWRK